MKKKEKEVFKIKGNLKDLFPSSDLSAIIVQLLQVNADLQYEDLLLMRKREIFNTERDQNRFMVYYIRRICSIIHEFINLLNNIHPDRYIGDIQKGDSRRVFWNLHKLVESQNEMFVEISQRILTLIPQEKDPHQKSMNENEKDPLRKSIKDIRNTTSHYTKNRMPIKSFLKRNSEERTLIDDFWTYISTYYQVTDAFWVDRIITILKKNKVKGETDEDLLISMSDFLIKIHHLALEYISLLVKGFFEDKDQKMMERMSYSKLVFSSDTNHSSFLEESIKKHLD